MEKGNYISTILRSNRTVFSFKDIVLLWGEPGTNTARVRINYYIKKNKLYRIRKGFYSKDKNYDKYELATKICTPSYISFETVLGQSGITFQYYSQIFVASYLTRELKVNGQIYSLKRMKDLILTNQIGIEAKDNYYIAFPERAFLDVIYLNKDYYFDNLSPLNWDKVFKILPIYKNKRMVKKVDKYFKDFKDNQ